MIHNREKKIKREAGTEVSYVVLALVNNDHRHKATIGHFLDHPLFEKVKNHLFHTVHKMRLHIPAALLLLSSSTWGFQPLQRPSKSIVSSSRLFLADEIKEYRQGLSAISGKESDEAKVSVVNLICVVYRNIFLNSS